MPKLTKRFVESISPDSHKDLTHWDSDLKGFGVVVLPSGRRTYCIQYRNQDRVLKRHKIGVHGHLTAEEARDLVRKKLGQVAQGVDPAAQKKTNNALPTMSDLVSDYFERHGEHKRAKSKREDRDMANNFILPAFARTRVSQITLREIQLLHLQLRDIPYRANRVLALLSKMFTLAISWGWRDSNPVIGIKKYREEKRDRWLKEDELNRLWEVLESHSDHITAYVFKFLILTGARKGEALGATWDQFDLEQGVWTKPSHLTKQKMKEHLPLSEKAIEVLQTVKGRTPKGSIYVFPGRIEGEPLKEIKTFWKTALTKAKLENVRIHDLRHTHASHLVSSGLSLSCRS